MSSIDFQEVRFSYDGHSNALDGITLDIEGGSFVCVLGGNGSGKSTFARHIDALLLPDSGEVRILGLPTSESNSLLEIRKKAGLVFQNPDDQIVAAIVEDDVAFGPENLGISSEELPNRVKRALERVGLKRFAKHQTYALSGGQKQRVAIAGAYAMEPNIIVFDEAGSMLDPRGRRSLMRLCHKLNDDGMTIVLITHFMEEAAEADRIIVLDSGQAVMDGSPKDVLSQVHLLQDLNLEAPFAVKMSMALQDAGMPISICVNNELLEQEITLLLDSDAEKKVPKEGVVREEVIETIVEVETKATAVPVITLEDVSFSYATKRVRKTTDKDVWAVHDVSLSLNNGDFLGIAGHTGSGKSTLLQLIAGILQPTYGDVLVRGRNLSSKHDKSEMRRSIGLVFQYPEHQLFAPTVYEDIAFGPRNLGYSAEEVDEQVRKALEMVHLHIDAVGHRSPFELSGGMQRRVALAGVLAMQPEVLILDEPTAGLDPKSHERFLNLISELHETSNAATVIVSHSMDDLAQLCNRIILMDEGRVVADGTPALIFSDEEAIRRIGLDVPYTVHLANSVEMEGAFEHVPTVCELARHIAVCYKATLAPSRNWMLANDVNSKGSRT